MFFLIFLLAFFICLAFTFIVIRFASKVQNPVRDYLPKTENEKVKISPFGGICVFLAISISSAFFISPQSFYLLLPTFCMLLLGLIDDLQKILSKSWRGISAKIKFLIQSIITLIVCFAAFKMNPHFANLILVIPFYKVVEVPVFLPLSFIISYFTFAGTVNAVNLTDGLDGLAGKQMFAIFTFLGIMLLKRDFTYVSASIQDITLIVFAALGATLAFLCFNSNPAKIFMGDSGSMAYGALLGSIFILFKMEIMLVFIGFIIFIEALSVIMQVAYFKYTKGKRIFRMSPLHHHFQLCGVKEQKITEIAFFITILIGVFLVSALF